MEKGFNSDIQIRGQKFHVQTEDWGYANPFVVSRIFCDGAVVNTIKVGYDEILKPSPTTPLRKDDAIRKALRDQHHRIIDQLMSGRSL